MNLKKKVEIFPVSYQPTKHKKLITASTRYRDDTVEQVQPEQATQEFYSRLCAQLNERFSYVQPISVLVLRISQREIVRSAPHTNRLYERYHYHVSTGLLEQVLIYVRRAIRVNDKMIVYERSGAALVFPDVDGEVARQILERIYNNIRLLQAETLLPPLTRETSIQLGIGSYSATKIPLKLFQYSVESKARHLTLRPALKPQQENLQPIIPYALPHRQSHEKKHQHPELANAPFMQLPAVLPSSVKQLIPHATACKLHCAPVGREQKHLTVAMQDPANTENVRHLQKITGMTIFPVSCEEKALASLLAIGW